MPERHVDHNESEPDDVQRTRKFRYSLVLLRFVSSWRVWFVLITAGIVAGWQIMGHSQLWGVSVAGYLTFLFLFLGTAFRMEFRPLIIENKLEALSDDPDIQNLEVYIFGLLTPQSNVISLASSGIRGILHSIRPVDQSRLSDEDVRQLVVALPTFKDQHAKIIIKLFRCLRDRRALEHLHERELLLASRGVNRELRRDEIVLLQTYKIWQQEIALAIGETSPEDSITLLRSSEAPQDDESLLRPAKGTGEDQLLRPTNND